MNYDSLKELETIANNLLEMDELEAAIEHLVFVADNAMSRSMSLRIRDEINEIKRQQVKEEHGL